MAINLYFSWILRMYKRIKVLGEIIYLSKYSSTWREKSYSRMERYDHLSRQKWSDGGDFFLNHRKFAALSIMHEAEESRSISQNKTCTCSSSIYSPSILYSGERTILYAWRATNFRFYVDSPRYRAGMTRIGRKIVVRFDTRDKNPQNVHDSAHISI